MTETGPVVGRRTAVTRLLTATTGLGLGVIGCGALAPYGPPSLVNEGIAVGRAAPLVSVPPGAASAYVTGTSLLTGGRGDLAYAAATAARVAESRFWLGAGHVPDAGFTAMAERCLLDLRLLAQAGGETGAMPAGPAGGWWFVWPRDTAFAVAAFCVTGHRGEAERALGFLVRHCPRTGQWQARYRLDGRGSPDDRHDQADGAGWVLWAVRFWYVTERDPARAAAGLAAYWPMVRYSAGLIAASLDRDGLPPASPDYWERDESRLTLGTVAPLLAGLRAATDLARRTGHRAEAEHWSAATRRLDAGMDRAFARHRYQRYGKRGGADTAITFLGPPFTPATARISEAQQEALSRLRLPDEGGVIPGEAWPRRDSVAWTPETAMFALATAAAGDRRTAHSLLAWLNAHRTRLGALPEKVAPNGTPASVAPLGWTASTTLLALATLENRLPPPP